jgi:hypothetical protein
MLLSLRARRPVGNSRRTLPSGNPKTSSIFHCAVETDASLRRTNFRLAGYTRVFFFAMIWAFRYAWSSRSLIKSAKRSIFSCGTNNLSRIDFPISLTPRESGVWRGFTISEAAEKQPTGRESSHHSKLASAIVGHPDIPCFLLVDDPANEQPKRFSFHW